MSSVTLLTAVRGYSSALGTVFSHPNKVRIDLPLRSGRKQRTLTGRYRITMRREQELQTHFSAMCVNRIEKATLHINGDSLTPFMSGLKELYAIYDKQYKNEKYWTLSEVIEEADQLFEERKFEDAYRLLMNRTKSSSSSEVQWRIGRSLYKLSTAEGVTKKVQKEMIEEANYVLNASLKEDPQNPNIHKWIALVTHAKAGMIGTSARIKSYEFVLAHLQEAVRLNPADVVSLYMLGKLCYELASLTTFQRFIAKTLYHPPPVKSFKDALQYFLEAEKAKPRFYLPNLYMLGITHLKLNKMFSARYYLEVAAGIPPRTRMETEYAKKSKELADRLDKYDLTQKEIFPDVPFDN